VAYYLSHFYLQQNVAVYCLLLSIDDLFSHDCSFEWMRHAVGYVIIIITTTTDEDSFLQKLKDSVTLRKYTNVDDSMPTSLDGKGQQLKKLHANLKSHQRMQTYIKSLMGRNLHFMKNTSRLKNEDFIKYAQQFLTKSYSKSEINFMIKLYSFCELYPRLSFTTLPIRKLKAKFKRIRELVSKEPTYWKKRTELNIVMDYIVCRILYNKVGWCF